MGRFSNLEFGDFEPLREEELLISGETRDENFYLRLADKCYRTARFEEALRYYSRSLEFNPNLCAGWVGQVQMLIELGEYKEARLWADKALEVHRDHPELLSAKAVAYARDGDIEKGLAFSDTAIRQKGITPYIWLARGEVILTGGGSNDEHCFLKAASEAKDDWFIRLLIGRVLNFYGKFSRALGWLQQAIEKDATQPFSWYAIGDCRLALGLVGGAQEAFKHALSLDPEFRPAQIALSNLGRQGIIDLLWIKLKGIFRRRTK